MIGFTSEIVAHLDKVAKAEQKAAFRNVGHGAARIRKDAQASIERSDEPSAPGTPPHTRRGHLRRAIVYDYDPREQSAVVGPRASIVGDAGAAHEFGEEFRGYDYDARAFMGPSLEKNVPRFAGDWEGSIGQ
jgi:hypothetical protein